MVSLKGLLETAEDRTAEPALRVAAMEQIAATLFGSDLQHDSPDALSRIYDQLILMAESPAVPAGVLSRARHLLEKVQEQALRAAVVTVR